MMKKLLVTGAAGLIGSEVVSWFSRLGWEIVGVDNNMRADFFGPRGDTRWNTQRMERELTDYRCIDVDIRDRATLVKTVREVKPDAVVHTAAQPSHDLAASRPFDDFDVNAVGTLNLLEAVRQLSTDIPFVHLSTNKVYGDAPNRLNLTEHETRWDFTDSEYYDGITESFTIDQSKHSVFGAS
jgi:CDP-paratose 2-epimerase